MTLYRDIISEIPSDLLNKIAIDTNVNYKISKLTGENLFNVLLYSLLEKNELSLRTISNNYQLLFNETIHHSSIASRLENIPIEYFKQIFDFLVKKFSNSEQNETKNLMIIDSTSLQLSNKLLNLGIPCASHSQKNMIKCVVATNSEFINHLNFITEAKNSSDSTTFREIILENHDGSICLFDRGLQKRKTFEEFINHEIQFITRGNDNISYKITDKNAEVSGQIAGKLELMEDVMTQLSSKHSRMLSFKIRLVKAKIIATGKIITFITSISPDQMNAAEICELYRKRWSIEVFFKFIKQELNARHFLGHKKNTIIALLYVVFIAAILILEYKKRSKFRGYKVSRRSFLNELRLEVMKPIIAFCGGDTEKIYDYYRDNKKLLI